MKARCQSRLPETDTLVSTFSGPGSDFRLSAGELSAVTSCDMGTPVLVPVSTYCTLRRRRTIGGDTRYLVVLPLPVSSVSSLSSGHNSKADGRSVLGVG